MAIKKEDYEIIKTFIHMSIVPMSIKKFKYKLVPKDKNGNYGQKGSGLEVKNF